MRAIGGLAAAQRVPSLRLVEEAPADWRSRIVQALNDPSFHVSLSPGPPEQLPTDADGPAKAIEDYVLQQLPGRPDRQIRAAVFEPAPFEPPFDRRPFPGTITLISTGSTFTPCLSSHLMAAVTSLRFPSNSRHTMPISSVTLAWRMLVTTLIFGRLPR